jgi:hypothetical protein
VGGILSNPQLTLTDSTGAVLGLNSAWNGVAALSQAFSQVGAFPLAAGSNDAALLVTLPAGRYSAGP